MNIVYFTLVAALLYLFSDWVLQRVEVAVGRRFEHRSLIFFAILLTFALTSFSLLGNLAGGTEGGRQMTDQHDHVDDTSPDDEPIPLMQRVLDNPFLLLFLGIAVPTVFYLIWGIIEITQIPIAD